MDTKVHEPMHIFWKDKIFKSRIIFFLSKSNRIASKIRELSARFSSRTKGNINEKMFIQEFSNYSIYK